MQPNIGFAIERASAAGVGRLPQREHHRAITHEDRRVGRALSHLGETQCFDKEAASSGDIRHR